MAATEVVAGLKFPRPLGGRSGGHVVTRSKRVMELAVRPRDHLPSRWKGAMAKRACSRPREGDAGPGQKRGRRGAPGTYMECRCSAGVHHIH
jgi:hypothetical protein